MSNPTLSVLRFRATGAIFVFDERYPGPAENKVAGYSLQKKKVRLFDRRLVEGQVDCCESSETTDSVVAEYQRWLQSDDGREYLSRARHWVRTSFSNSLPHQPSMSPAQFLKRFNPNCFYHFTDKRNLPSIRMRGLLPLAEIRRQRVDVPAPGGNDWSHEEDERRGLDKYVHLCFFDQHPMEWVAREREKRIADTIFIRVSTEVIYWDGVKFAAGVANKSGVETLSLAEACAAMDFSVIYDRVDWHDRVVQQRRQVAKKYELLVPSIIGPSHLAI